MNRIIFILLLLAGSVFAQYGPNITLNSYDWVDTDENGLADSWLQPSGDAVTYSIVTGNGFSGNAQRGVENNAIDYSSIRPVGENFINGTEYFFRVKYRSNNLFRIRNPAASTLVSSAANTGNAALYEVKVTANHAGNYFYFSVSGANGYWFEIDEAFCGKIIDTLWTDATNGSDTDDDTTATLSEAFELRGTHTNGYFITVAGTYNEDITFSDSSFTKWEASGGKVNITSVDFNSLTCLVDFNIWGTIETISNSENVTIIATAAAMDSLKYLERSNLLRLR